MIESSIVKYGDQVVTVDVGKPSNVEFNFMKIRAFAQERKKRGFWDPRNLNYYHVHPEGFLNYSQTDLRCAKGLHLGLGVCRNFHIITFNSSDLNDETYNFSCFLYNPDHPDRLIPELDSEGLDGYSLYLLKALSYGYVNL